MFMNTIAVPCAFFLVAEGTTVASDLIWCCKGAAFHLSGVDRAPMAGVITDAALESWHLE